MDTRLIREKKKKAFDLFSFIGSVLDLKSHFIPAKSLLTFLKLNPSHTCTTTTLGFHSFVAIFGIIKLLESLL